MPRSGDIKMPWDDPSPDYSPEYQDEYQRLWHEAERHRQINLREAVMWKEAFDAEQGLVAKLEAVLQDIVSLKEDEGDLETAQLMASEALAFVGSGEPVNNDDDAYYMGNRSDSVLGNCIHGVNLDREFCPQGCRV